MLSNAPQIYKNTIINVKTLKVKTSDPSKKPVPFTFTNHQSKLVFKNTGKNKKKIKYKT